MRRILVAAMCLLAVAIALPTSASAQGRTKFHQKYVHVYYTAKRKLGPDAVGRQIVSHGVRLKSGKTRPATKHEIAKSIHQLRRLLAPPPPPLVRTAVPPAQPPAGVMTASTASGGCTGMSAESGSKGYNAVGHHGGVTYIGCYQISADHYNGGACSGLGQDPAGQDKCAAIICRTEGAGAWHNGAGQNPCGRLGG
jgi:hypothetical protein